MLSISRTTWSRRALPWFSTRQNWRTERVPCSLECVEEMLQKSWLSRWTFQRYSRSLLRDPSLSRITTRNWLDRAKVHREGRTGKTNHTYHLSTEQFKRYQGQWYLTLNKSGKNSAYATSTRFSSCSLSQKPSSWVRWGTCRPNLSTAIQEMALFVKRFMVGHVQKLVELTIFF